MFTLIVIVFIAYCGYKFFGGGKTETTTTNKEQPVGALKDAVSTFRQDLAPIKAQVTTATSNARKAYEDAQHQRRIDALLSDPKLLADALEARVSKQSQLPAGE